MTTLSNPWGDLRSLLHRSTPAQPRHWRALLEQLEQIPSQEQRAQAIDYARALMTSTLWPDAIRALTLEDERPEPTVAPALPDHWPLVRTLILRRQGESIRPWLLAPDTAISGLIFRWHTVTREELRAWLTHPALEALQLLHLETSWVEADTIDALQGAPCLGTVRSFALAELEGDRCEEVAALLTRLTALEALSCPGSLYESGPIKKFCKGVQTNLKKLDLSNSYSLNDFIKRLSAEGRLDQLEHLIVSNYALTSAAVKQLCKIPSKVLHTLDLSGGQLGHKAIEAIADAPFASALRHLDLSDNSLRIISKSMSALTTSGIAARLYSLDLSSSDIAPKPLQILLDEPLPNLERLALRRSRDLGDKTLKILQNSELPSLRALDLDDHFMSFDKMLELCERAPDQWPNLEELHLNPYEGHLTLSAEQERRLKETLPPSIHLTLAHSLEQV